MTFSRLDLRRTINAKDQDGRIRGEKMSVDNKQASFEFKYFLLTSRFLF